MGYYGGGAAEGWGPRSAGRLRDGGGGAAKAVEAAARLEIWGEDGAGLMEIGEEGGRQ